MDNLVSKSTQEALMEFVKQCFAMNRFLDRAVSVLGVKFAMNQLADLVHHGLAHAYPNLGDICGEKCLEAYNISVIYLYYLSTPNKFIIYFFSYSIG